MQLSIKWVNKMQSRSNTYSVIGTRRTLEPVLAQFPEGFCSYSPYYPHGCKDATMIAEIILTSDNKNDLLMGRRMIETMLIKVLKGPNMIVKFTK